ncbi:MAG: PQQ-dependent sugar dehydrogenase [Saprospiraceae bacterium]|nr:PQQ-dependent sugar dehydrogenase [Saprospiraceae bacterium]
MKNNLTFLLLCFLVINALAQKPIAYLTQFANGFTRPCDIANCGDDRLFVVEQRGRIWILDANGNKLPNPFLDIDPSVGSSGNEQGLLGLAFHPNYPTTPHFYVNYTDNNGDTKVSRFSISTTDPNLADPSSELVLLTADQPYSNHNGGGVKFGPDGYLYIGLGDGGSGGDPQGNGQKKNTLLGKMLRIDVDGGNPYIVPATNPFINDSNYLPEIWALGLRNPWRFSFDRVTGDLWIGDVGQDAWEEIDLQPAASPGGENYGWRCYEGNHAFNTNNCLGASNYVPAVAEYVNGGGECSVTGGFVYRGSKHPMIYGHYLFTDYCSGKLWWLTPNTSGGYDREQLADFVNNQMVSFGENQAGELFMLGNGNGLVYSLGAWNYLVNTVNPACEGINDGSIQVLVSDNVTATVTWSDGFTGPNRDNLAAGNYSITITGPGNSSATQTITLAASESLSGTVTDASCPGATDGSIDLTLNGSTIQPSMAGWSDGSSDFDRTGLAAGSYSVTLVAPSGCLFNQMFTVGSQSGGPMPTISFIDDTYLVVNGTFTTYQWYVNDEPIAGADSTAFNVFTDGPIGGGIFTLGVTDANGCTGLSQGIDITWNEASTLSELTSVSVSPNPFQQSLQLSLVSKSPIDLDLNLKDQQGRTLLTDRLSVNGTATRSFQLGNLPSGTYLLILKNDKGEWAQRLLKL